VVIDEDLVDGEGDVVLRLQPDDVVDLLGRDLGIWIFLMMSSRPQTEMTASVPLMPALATASLMASATVWGR
jgi:hypothetical protein